jgi:radical SAM superfamily enzyme YgiQ (UPF0313 family)
MKLNIVFPKRDEGWYDDAIGKLAMPAAPTYLAALTPENIEVKIIDMMAGDCIDYEDPVDLVGITVRTPQAVKAYEIANKFRSRKVTVALGGPHVTTLPLDAKKHADTAVVGEAEGVWEKLLNDFQKNRLKDFYVGGPFSTDSLDGEIYQTKDRPSLNGLPHLRRDLLPRQRYRVDSIFTTKGCPYGCAFCGVPMLFGSNLRHRPIDEVVTEIETLPSSYMNIDDTIFGSAKDNQYYLDLFGELAKLSRKRFWYGEGALAVLDFANGKEILKRAAESGLFRLIIGIESVHGQGLTQARVRAKLGLKPGEDFNSEKIQKAIKTIQDFGIEIMGFIVIGYDTDTLDTFQKTLDFYHKAKIIPMVTILSPTPDSPIYKWLKSEGRLLPDIKWNQIVSDKLIFKHPSLTEDQLIKARDEILSELYGLIPVLRRVLTSFSNRRNPAVFFSSLFSQLGIRKGVKR